MAHVISRPNPTNYAGRLLNWDNRASVRVAPLRRFECTPGTHPFSPDLIPILSHPLVTARDDRARYIIMAQKLYTYLSFTEHLERKAVIPSCVDLSFGEVPFYVSRPLQRDASKIVTDEAHHAECAADLTDQMALTTGVIPHRNREPAFMNKIREAEANLGGDIRKLASLTFTAVSETLITSTLTKVPADPTVNPVIRDIIMDHARDEAKHHACFSDVICMMWDQISGDKREIVGPLFADFILAFLIPDLISELDWLEAAGFDAKEAERVLSETYQNFDQNEVIRAAAKPTIALLQKYGVLDHAPTFEAFQRKMLT